MLYRLLFITIFLLQCNTALAADLPTDDEITISAVGDNTLGYAVNSGYYWSFNQIIDRYGMDYPYKNVQDIFTGDDLTIANLETTLTSSTQRAVKKFTFAGKPVYREILVRGGIDAVNLANNHTMDYLKNGYDDTIRNLDEANVGFFGNGVKLVKEVKGVRVGMLGYTGWAVTDALKSQIKKDITALKKQAQLVIVSFHWGKEGAHYPNTTQKYLGRYAIDAGADLVLGHHPHVMQGIEDYKGKKIVYSLGNFVFGGNRNPADKDTFIYQQKFNIDSFGNVICGEAKVIPASVTSIPNRNNYQPRVLDGSAAQRVLNRLRSYSGALQFAWKF